MDNLFLMQRIQASYHLIEDRPDICFFHIGCGLFQSVNFCLKISSVCVLHHYAKCASCSFEKRLLVARYVWVVNRGLNSNFVYRIVLFLLREFGKFDLVEN